MIQVDKVIVGPIETNCYIIENQNKILIVDPGDEYKKINKKISDKEILGILLTHRHYDHIGALNKILQDYNCPIYEYINTEEKTYSIDPFEFEIIKTPGHCSDAITFFFKKENIMFVGDFIFKGTIGRCDLPTGDYKTMMKSIDKIKKNPNVTLYPGHGDETTLDYEKQTNPYF